MAPGDSGGWQVFCGINGEPDHRQFRTAYQHQCSGSNMRQGWIEGSGILDVGTQHACASRCCCCCFSPSCSLRLPQSWSCSPSSSSLFSSSGLAMQCCTGDAIAMEPRTFFLCYPVDVGSSQIKVPFEVPNIVRHPYKKDPKRDPSSENYPCVTVCRRFGGCTGLQLPTLGELGGPGVSRLRNAGRYDVGVMGVAAYASFRCEEV